MARIISYQYDDDIKDGDAWIGTEATSRRTKQYTAQAVANYLNINGSISIVGQMTYKYVVTPESETGSFAIFGGGPDPVAFSAVTKLTLSNTDVSGQRVVEFLELLVNSDILISRQSEISTFGYYSIDSYAVNTNNPDYYDLSVTFKSGNGSMEAGKIYETQNFTLAAEENISTLQTTIDAGNTYQEGPSNTLWAWGTDAITATSSTFTSLLSGKRFKTTLIADGSYTDVLPNSINFNDASGNETSITTNTGLSSNINLQWPPSSGTLALTTDITASPWDDVTGGINYAGGNVGIGTTSPDYNLQVESSGNAEIHAKRVSGAGVLIQAQALVGVVGTSTNHRLDLKTSGSTRATIMTNGNVGIGTTSPSTTLDVAGSITTSGAITGPSLFEIVAQYTNRGRITLSSSTSTGANQISLLTNGNVRMVVNKEGNVGIGTTSPSQKLEVSGNVKLDGDNRHIYFGGNNTFIGERSNSTELELRGGGNSTAQTVYIDNTGQIGVGTSNPTSKLDVAGGDIELDDAAAGIIMRSPDGTKYKITVANGGTLTVTAV